MLTPAMLGLGGSVDVLQAIADEFGLDVERVRAVARRAHEATPSATSCGCAA